MFSHYYPNGVLVGEQAYKRQVYKQKITLNRLNEKK